MHKGRPINFPKITPPPSPRDNERQATVWSRTLCYLCWYPGTVTIGGHLYCAQHAPKEGHADAGNH